MKNLLGLRNAHHMMGVQFLLILLLIRLGNLTLGINGVLTVFLAGLTFMLPYAFFAHVVFRDMRASLARQYLKRIYRGEVAKIALSIVLFVAIFCFFKIIPWVFFSVYFLMQLTVWISPWIFITRECAQ